MNPLDSLSNESPMSEAGGGKNQIVELLVREKVLTAKQVEYASRVLSKIETSRSILEVLKKLNFVDEDQIKDTVRNAIVRLGINEVSNIVMLEDSQVFEAGG